MADATIDAAKARSQSPAAASVGAAPSPSASTMQTQRPSLSESAAKQGNDILDHALAGMGFGNRDKNAQPAGDFDDVVMTPNGGQVSLRQFLDHDYIAEDHSSIFARDPGTYIKEPDPDAMYVWPAKADAHLYAHIRSGRYIAVGFDELREDCELPVTTHTVPGIVNDDGLPTRLVAVYDLILMKVPPKAVKRLYRWHAYQALLKTKQNLPFEQLRDWIHQESRGLATVEMRSKVEL